MTTVPRIDAVEFVEAVEPLLEAQDVAGLDCVLRRRWSADQIASLLGSENRDARKVAALALALVGDSCCVQKLAERLRDPDRVTSEMAEHALWSIWLRLGPKDANHEIARGVLALNHKAYDQALVHFNHAIALAPDLAEAYHQRGIVHYLLDRYEEAIEDWQRTVELMPCHFGAWSGIGHCLAHLERFAEARDAYEHALSVNPHLDCVQQAISELAKRAD